MFYDQSLIFYPFYKAAQHLGNVGFDFFKLNADSAEIRTHNYASDFKWAIITLHTER